MRLLLQSSLILLPLLTAAFGVADASVASGLNDISNGNKRSLDHSMELALPERQASSKLGKRSFGTEGFVNFTIRSKARGTWKLSFDAGYISMYDNITIPQRGRQVNVTIKALSAHLSKQNQTKQYEDLASGFQYTRNWLQKIINKSKQDNSPRPPRRAVARRGWEDYFVPDPTPSSSSPVPSATSSARAMELYGEDASIICAPMLALSSLLFGIFAFTTRLIVEGPSILGATLTSISILSGLATLADCIIPIMMSEAQFRLNEDPRKAVSLWIINSTLLRVLGKITSLGMMSYPPKRLRITGHDIEMGVYRGAESLERPSQSVLDEMQKEGDTAADQPGDQPLQIKIESGSDDDDERGSDLGDSDEQGPSNEEEEMNQPLLGTSMRQRPQRKGSTGSG